MRVLKTVACYKILVRKPFFESGAKHLAMAVGGIIESHRWAALQRFGFRRPQTGTSWWQRSVVHTFSNSSLVPLYPNDVLVQKKKKVVLTWTAIFLRRFLGKG